MTAPPRTGIERLLRLRALQIAKARSASEAAQAACRQADARRQQAEHGLAALAVAQHEALSQPCLDLARYHRLLDCQQEARDHHDECARSSEEQQRRLEESLDALDLRLRQGKAAEQRDDSLRQALRRALDNRQESLSTETWLNRRGRR